MIEMASRFLPQLLLHHVGRKLERLGDRHPADLPRGHIGEHEVVSFQRPTEDRSSSGASTSREERHEQ